MRLSVGFGAVSVVALFAPPTFATLDYSSIGGTYSQFFDGLASSGIDNPWTNDVTIDGWYLFRRNSSVSETPGVAVSVYDTTDGNSINSKFYSFGTPGNGERALGAIGGSTFDGQPGLAPSFGMVAGWIAVGFVNNSGTVLDQFTVSFDGEQWFDPGDGPGEAPQTMVFQYGIGDTFDTANWVAPGGNFDWNAPVDDNTQLYGFGNTTGSVPNRGGTLTNVNWGDGQTLWLRWLERNDIGADAGMGIDNFSFSATAVPEPAAAIYGGAATALATLVVLTKIVKVNFRKRK